MKSGEKEELMVVQLNDDMNRQIAGILSFSDQAICQYASAYIRELQGRLAMLEADANRLQAQIDLLHKATERRDRRE